MFMCVCYSNTRGKEYTLLLFYPLPSTNSCHAWWQRNHCTKSNQAHSVLPLLAGKTRRGQEESLAGHRGLRGIKCQEQAEKTADKMEWGFSWTESFGTCQWVIFFFSNHTHTKSTHGFYLKGNQGKSDGHPSQTCSGLQAVNESWEQLCGSPSVAQGQVAGHKPTSSGQSTVSQWLTHKQAENLH